MAPINAITSTARMDPTTIGRSGTPVPDFVRIGALRPALPLRAPAEAFARDRVAMTLGRIPTSPFWLRPVAKATVGPEPEPIGRRSPVAGLRSSVHRPDRKSVV